MYNQQKTFLYMNITDEYINTHIEQVRFKLMSIASKLLDRAYKHDSSKLSDPEYTLWCNMDKEPRYKYGTKEYKDKIKRYKQVFDLHYAENRHHPEHYFLGVDDMDLIDMIEMVCDWISYKKDITIGEAIEMINTQGERYKLSPQLQNILKNTLFNHFSTLVQTTSIFNKPEDNPKDHFIDIKI